DSDHVATLSLAHWPGQASPWIDDLRRIARYCSALGKWVTVDDYFCKTDQPGQLDRFEASRYRSPYLKQAIIRKQDNPISTQVRYWQRQATAGAAQVMETLAELVRGRQGDREQGAGDGGMAGPALGEELLADAEQTVNVELETAACNLTTALTSASKSSPRGCLIINPGSVIRRIG